MKQHRTLFGSRLVLFSLLIWPALELALTYYTFRPVATAPGAARQWAVAGQPHGVILFFLTGALCFNCFWSLVQSALQFSYERMNGTLELIFLSPANRLVMVLANSLGAVVQSAWLFIVFGTGVAVLLGGLHMASAGMLIVAFCAMLIPAVAWGAFLNSLTMFSRDSGIVFTIFSEPMMFFSGSRVPLFALPAWAKAFSFAFPLTLSLVVVRGSILDGDTLQKAFPDIAILLAISLLLVLIAAAVLRIGETRARRTGQLQFF